jgi:LysM repeat protein
MLLRRAAALAAFTLCLLPGAAQAATHLIAPGETLTGIAAANGVSPAALAAANGLSPTAFVIEGRTLTIPAPGTAVTPVANADAGAPAPLGGYRVRLGDTLSGIAAEHGLSVAQLAAANGLNPNGVLLVGTSLRLTGTTTPSTTTATGVGVTANAAGGGHIIRPGETLSGIAAANGITLASLAAANGLPVSAHIIAGRSLRIPAGAPAASTPAAATPSAPAGPAAIGGRMTATQIGQIAARNGAPSSLAQAIAWQESGFNNNMVSVANARGIMQVMPATWQYVEQNLAGRSLNPASPADNVGAGSLLLARLLRDTGGDVPTAIAGYYQGLGSVRRIGMLPETRRYVANVLALRSRFGG